jgi:hypothetical protein
MDNTFLTLLLNPKAAPRPNPATGKPVPYCRERIDSLIDEISARSGTLIVPAPSLAECLCGTDSPAAYIEALAAYDNIEVAPFDQRAAYELSQAIRKADTAGDKRSGQLGNWQHVKMDRTIVAIALVYGATTLYSDDDRQCNFANMSGLATVHTWDLDLSSKWSQAHLQDGSDRAWPEQKVPPKPTLGHPRIEGRPEDA